MKYLLLVGGELSVAGALVELVPAHLDGLGIVGIGGGEIPRAGGGDIVGEGGVPEVGCDGDYLGAHAGNALGLPIRPELTDGLVGETRKFFRHFFIMKMKK
jgi:hypothetical protein